MCGTTYFVILVGSDCHELRSGEDEHVVLTLIHFSNACRFDHVQPRLVLVHAVDNDLRERNLE